MFTLPLLAVFLGFMELMARERFDANRKAVR
jgi:hypothetical protein